MGISIWQLLIVLAIVLVIFGAKRLRTLGGDLGSAVKNFREAVRDSGADDKSETEQIEHSRGDVMDAEVQREAEQAKERDKV